MTFSIVARSDDGQSWGVAVASKFLAVGSVVPAAIAGVGALATQADANVAWKAIGLGLLDEGLDAPAAAARMIDDDDKPEHRQLGMVDPAGTSATHTGSECLDWAGGVAAPGVAIQGNILAGPQVVEAMQRTWQDGRPAQPLGAPTARRAGSRRRGRRRPPRPAVGCAARCPRRCRVRRPGRHRHRSARGRPRQPIRELARLLDLNDFYLTPPAEADRVPVTAELAAELDTRARALGHDSFLAWVGTENYEMRVGEDANWVDQRVLEIIRRA